MPNSLALRVCAYLLDPAGNLRMVSSGICHVVCRLYRSFSRTKVKTIQQQIFVSTDFFNYKLEYLNIFYPQ